MRQLTFSGFTKQYISSLSPSGSTGVYKLVTEMAQNNSRMEEPLFLYAMCYDSVSTLLKATKGTEYYGKYLNLSQRFDKDSLLLALETQSDELPERYLRVWTSYQRIVKHQERDDDVKRLMSKRVRELLFEANVSVYRVSKDLSLNAANVNAWLKNEDPKKIGMDSARRVLQYVENAAKAVSEN